jgi:hypothetical protein
VDWSASPFELTVDVARPGCFPSQEERRSASITANKVTMIPTANPAAKMNGIIDPSLETGYRSDSTSGSLTEVPAPASTRGDATRGNDRVPGLRPSRERDERASAGTRDRA